MPAPPLTPIPTLLLIGIASFGWQSQAHSQEYDSMVAEMPLAHAATGSVALAKLNIALRTARQQAQQRLCQGRWNPVGRTIQVTGPEPARSTDGSRVWRYQSLRQAHPLACTGVSRAQFFLETSRYLPAWITIRPAGYSIVFRNADSKPLPAASFAGR